MNFDFNRAAGDELQLLYRRWLACLRDGFKLPAYEDVALGGIGRLNELIALVRENDDGEFEIKRIGSAIQDWFGTPATRLLMRELPLHCIASLQSVVHRSRRHEAPAQCRTYKVVDGTVERFDLLALPLASRWGPPITLICLKGRSERQSLVETIFASTDEGMLALAPLLDMSGDAVDFQIIAFNDGAARLLDCEHDDLNWKFVSELKSDGDHGLLGKLLQTLAAGERGSFDLSLASAPTQRHFRIGVVSIGELVSISISDIGDIKAREQSFRLLFDGNPVPMWLIDPDSFRFLQVNDAAVHHYGYSREKFLEMTALDIRPERDREVARRTLAGIADAYHGDRIWDHLLSDGTEIEVLPYLRLMQFEGRQVVLSAIVDVTEQRRAEARIVHMAHHDALTGLPNRVLFRERLDEALSRAMRTGDDLAILCLDLDHFKSVNDTLGHPAGDKLLRVVADRLRENLRSTTLAARLGGDEFALIETSTRDPSEASSLAARLIEALSRPYEIDGHQVVIGVSVGIAISPSDGTQPDILLKHADMALYRAKVDGRNTARFFEREMDALLRARRLLETDLRKALANDEFEIFYQPQVEVRTADIKGFEALLRWNHPQRGMVSPAEFIPLAEEIGLIVQIGEWVLHRACQEAASWSKPLSVAVNLSPVQFKSNRLVTAVIDALTSSNLDATRLELEITESVLLQDSESNLEYLHQLKRLGVRVSMDDFGTGYSSLGYLHKFPFDKIKIDQSFIRDLGTSPEAAAIVRAVTGLGISLGILTTAEGVETPEQLSHLRAEGCTEVQGYLFSRPRPANEIEPFIAKFDGNMY